MQFCTGYYINMYDKGMDVILTIGEANDIPTHDQIIKAEEILEKWDYSKPHWKSELEVELEDIFPFGVNVYLIKRTVL